MTDQPTPMPDHLFQARTGLLFAVHGLVCFARTLPEGGVERTTVREAIREASTALTRVFPHALATAAQGHAIRTLELRPPVGEELTPISGQTLELYADQLARYLFAHGAEEHGA